MPLQNSEDLPPLDSTVHVKRVEEGDEPPGWYRARVSEYFQDDLVQLYIVLMILQRLTLLKPSIYTRLNGSHVCVEQNILYLSTLLQLPLNLKRILHPSIIDPQSTESRLMLMM